MGEVKKSTAKNASLEITFYIGVIRLESGLVRPPTGGTSALSKRMIVEGSSCIEDELRCLALHVCFEAALRRQMRKIGMPDRTSR